jgi:hypothetical protein
MTRHLPTDTGPAAVHHVAQTDHAVLALHLESGEGCYNGRDRVPTGAAFPLRAQAALSQQPPPERNVQVNCDGTVIESRRRACLRVRNHMLHVDCLNHFNVRRIQCFYFLQPEAPMPKKKQTTGAGTSTTKIRTTAAVTKRIEQWSKANGDDARSESMLQLLARGFRPAKRKVQRTKA